MLCETKAYALPDVDVIILDFFFKSATLESNEVLPAKEKTLLNSFIFQGFAMKVTNQSSQASLHICTMAKEDIIQSKDCKFAQGMQVTCPYLSCTFKNAIHSGTGRFPAGYYTF